MAAAQRKPTGKKRMTNKGSQLLTDDENKLLFTYLGANNFSIQAGVAQLLEADPNPRKWALKHTGVVVLVKDFNQRTYFLRMFNMAKGTKVWEQQLYDNFRVDMKMGVLLTFEGDKSVFGLNFSHSSEARVFKTSFDTRYEKEQRDKGRGGGQQMAPAAAPQPTTGITSSNMIPFMPVDKQAAPVERKKKKDKKGKTKLSKADISAPTNYVHVCHVGWDENKGWSLGDAATTDPTIKDLLQHTGLAPEELKSNKRMEQTFVEFAKQYGGFDELKRAYEHERQSIAVNNPPRRPPPTHQQQTRQPMPVSSPAPPPPPREVSAPMQTIQHTTPTHRHQAPPTPRQPPQSRPLPTQHHQSPPPPPPAYPQPQQLQQYDHSPPRRPSRIVKPDINANVKPPIHQTPTPPQQSSASRPANIPPPPPPPPPMGNIPPVGGGPPPPPPPPAMNVATPTPAVPDARANLLADIRGGAKLRHVDSDTRSAGSGGGDAKGDLMAQIRSGAQLKPVDPNDRRSQCSDNSADEQPATIADMLRKAFEDRRRQIESDSDEDDDDENNDDEWDD